MAPSVHELSEALGELCKPRARPVADDPFAQRPRLHKRHPPRAQVLEPVGPGRRAGVDKVLDAILRVMRGHYALVPRAGPEDLDAEGLEDDVLGARPPPPLRSGHAPGVVNIGGGVF